ncbi:MAG: ATPase [Alphaproteobacteria bacterium]|jgi:chaperone required for assembly of F1-ATPase|nr:ATPase [Alphaproteobacteria bacterium]
MKRFYESAEARAVEGGYEVSLDGRPVRTPGRQKLTFPSVKLAEASAAEWSAQGETLDMAAMPLTALSYATLDRIAEDPGRFVDDVTRFAETDLLCYRAPTPAKLVARQAGAWDPLLAWLLERYGARLILAEGIMPVEQPESAIAAIRQAFAALDPFRLTAAHVASQAAGSAVIALALVEGEITPTTAADAAQIDDDWQLEQWGEDEEARELMVRRRSDLEEIGHFLALLE